jgi:hypothetical protein
VTYEPSPNPFLARLATCAANISMKMLVQGMMFNFEEIEGIASERVTSRRHGGG